MSCITCLSSPWNWRQVPALIRKLVTVDMGVSMARHTRDEDITDLTLDFRVRWTFLCVMGLKSAELCLKFLVFEWDEQTMFNENNRNNYIVHIKTQRYWVNMGSIRTFIQRLWERREQTVTVSAPVKTKKREIRVLRVVTVLDWDGQRLTVVLVVSAMMDENYGWE